MYSPNHPLIIGTRASLLARTQTSQVAAMLQAAHPGLPLKIELITSSGDQIQDRPLHEFGGKGLFTKEIEQALLDQRIDLAVHSLKDLPVTQPLVDSESLTFISPLREDPRDLLVSRLARRIEDLPARARVGTGSLRRRSQLLDLRPDLIIEPIRGNIDTRLRKLRGGEYDAVILALAGVKRAGLFDESDMTPIPIATLLPAAGQAALAIQYRADDPAAGAIAAAIADESTLTAVTAERALVSALNGDCHSPIAAYARLEGQILTLAAAVGKTDGDPPVARGQAVGSPQHTDQILANVLAALHES